MSRLEDCHYADADFELRGKIGAGGVLVGRAVNYNSPATIGAMFREQFAPHAFKKTLKERQVVGLLHHDKAKILGRTPTTMRLQEDERGLPFEIDLPDTETAREAWELVDRGDLTGASVGFKSIKEDVERPRSRDELPLVTVREAALYEISIVAFPAYEDTTVFARSSQRIAVACGVSVEDVMEAANAGELARLWTPREVTTSEPPTEPPVIEEHSEDTTQPEPRHIRVPIYL